LVEAFQAAGSRRIRGPGDRDPEFVPPATDMDPLTGMASMPQSSRAVSRASRATLAKMAPDSMALNPGRQTPDLAEGAASRKMGQA
jgi:hypothetical protein